MTIKEQAYRAHAFLQARGGASLKRSHIYELLAATVGYATYAAFQHDATWCDVPFSRTGIAADAILLTTRCTELGIPTGNIPTIVAAIIRFQHDAGYAPVRPDALIDAIEGDEEANHWQQWIRTHLVEPASEGVRFYLTHQRVLLDGLEAAAERGLPSAHLAIAKLLESEAMLFGDEEERVRRQVRREGTWIRPFVGFADVEANGLRLEEKYRYHLLAAARGGDLRALIETAERYGDPAILQLQPSQAMDPMRMAALAAENEDDEKLRYWLTVAAQEGDTGAMRELILNHDEVAEQAWVWMYLSRLLGQDLSQDRFEAINEDGTPYDDDAGGPAYVGGNEGIDLALIPAGVDATARHAAAQLFARIGNRSGHL